MRGGWSKAVWNFSEVSSVLVCPSVPKGEVKSSQTDLAPKEATKGKKWTNFDDPELEAEYKAKHKARSKAKKAKLKERRPQRVDCRCFHNFHS